MRRCVPELKQSVSFVFKFVVEGVLEIRRKREKRITRRYERNKTGHEKTKILLSFQRLTYRFFAAPVADGGFFRSFSLSRHGRRCRHRPCLRSIRSYGTRISPILIQWMVPCSGRILPTRAGVRGFRPIRTGRCSRSCYLCCW